MTQDILSDRDLNVIFREARSFKGWQDTPVSEITIRAMYDLLRWGPTSFNCSPARFVIIQSAEAKQKLADCVMDSNKDKILSAPFTVIVGSDAKFYDKLP
ncbi:MAG: nitroreductase family protein, partial [Emcibacter sp.]|nr:nitroreductase family protein [Emcibacter sp.]